MSDKEEIKKLLFCHSAQVLRCGVGGAGGDGLSDFVGSTF